MRAALVLATALAAPLVLAHAAADAGGAQTASALYVGPANPVSPRIECAAGAPGCIGGAIFPPTGGLPLHVDVRDAVLPVVDILACQDADADGHCGEPGEPRYNGCGTTLPLQLPWLSFRSDLPTTVFVIAGARCAFLVETVGTITMHYG